MIARFRVIRRFISLRGLPCLMALVLVLSASCAILRVNGSGQLAFVEASTDKTHIHIDDEFSIVGRITNSGDGPIYAVLMATESFEPQDSVVIVETIQFFYIGPERVDPGQTSDIWSATTYRATKAGTVSCTVEISWGLNPDFENWVSSSYTFSFVIESTSQPSQKLTVEIVSPPSPPNGGAITTTGWRTYQVAVTSGGIAIDGADVTWYIDGTSYGTGPTFSGGYATMTERVAWSPGSTHYWYAVATKSGYVSGTSPTWSFTYSPSSSQLSVSIVSPPSPSEGSTVTSLPITLRVRVTSDGSPVQGASVTFAIGALACVSPGGISLQEANMGFTPTDGGTGSYGPYQTDSNGYASHQITEFPSWIDVDWWATASKSGYQDGTSPDGHFIYSSNLPQLSVSITSPPSPSNGGTVTSLPMTLQVRVTSGGSPVSGASVKFYLDGNPLPGSPFSSDQDGYASLTFASGSLTSGTTIRWYATVQKSGYADGQSPTWSFTYSVARGSSAISAKVSTSTIIIGRRVTVSGFIDPPHSAIVTLRFTKPDHASIERTSTSSASGYYSYAFAVDSAGIWSVETSWLGDDDHVGSESLAQSFEVVSETRLIVTVVDAETNEELAGVEVTLDPSGEVRRTDENQPAVFLVQLGRSYTIHAEMEGYESNEIEVDVPASVEYDVQVKLTPVREFSGTGKIVSCTSEEIYGGYPFSIHVSVLGSVSEKTKGVLEASIEGFSIATSKKFDVSGSFYEDGIELYFKTSPTEGTVRFHVTLTLVNPSTGELVQEDSTTFEEQIAGVQWDKAKVKLRIQCTGDTPWFSNIEAGAARIELWSSSGQREDVTDRFKDAWWKNWCMPTIDGEFELDPGFSYAFYVRFDTGNWVGARICYRFDVEIQDMITLAARETQITVTLHYSKEGGEYSVWGDVKVSPDIAGVRYVEEGYSHD